MGCITASGAFIDEPNRFAASSIDDDEFVDTISTVRQRFIVLVSSLCP